MRIEIAFRRLVSSSRHTSSGFTQERGEETTLSS